jgi:NF-X1-type zinc finger protein NFXL1
LQEKEPETEKNVPKRRKRRQRVQEGKQMSRLQVCYFLKGKKWALLSSKFPFICLLTATVPYKQKILATTKWVLLIVTLVVVLIAIATYGCKGLMWLSDWMNEVEEQRQRRAFRRVWPFLWLFFLWYWNVNRSTWG